MSDPSEKKFRYEFTLQYSGTVEVYPEPDDDDIAEQLFMLFPPQSDDPED